MDVMSMLNSSTESSTGAVLQQQAVERMKGLPRNRTPWDAGGYSLPIHSHLHESFSNHPGSNKSPTQSPVDQVTHKLSNSHSSVSSFAASDSTSHSRLSSSSTTVSNSHHTKHTSTHGIFPLTETDSRLYRAGRGCSSPVSPFSGRSTRYTASPSEQFSDLTLVPEQRLTEDPWAESMDQPSANAETGSVESASRVKRRKESRPSKMPPRPASPSDAIMIKRTTSSLSPSISERFDLVVTESDQSRQPATGGGDAFTFSEPQSGRLSLQTAAHKRAVSAPDLPAAVETSTPDQTRPSASSGPAAELTPPSSESPDTSSLDATMSPRALAMPLDPSSPSQDGEPCCMYMPNCTTGSALRKAVSHIFGRNKMATRRIPKHVWVWYCRKHYQRARYRNSLEWAKTLQYDLVTQQVKRLQNWSDCNRASGRGDVVTGYRLAVRKREQRRLDAKKPRSEREFSECDDDAEFGEHSNTAVPKWLLDLCGRDHDFQTILKVVVDGIRDDLATAVLSAWPDIEILPNIVLDEEEPESPKGYTKRRHSAGAHRRTQSLSTALPSDDYPGSQFVAQSRGWPDSSGPTSHGNVTQKRKRYDELEEEDTAASMSPQTQFRVREPLVSGNRNDHLSVIAPSFRETSDGQYGSEEFSSRRTNGDLYGLSPISHHSPLPAPTPRRGTLHSTAAHIDSGLSIPETSYARSRRGAHKRSQSDMTSFQDLQPSRGPSRHRGLAPVLQHHGGHAPRRLLSPPSFSSSTYRTEPPAQESANHIRHQSTPTVLPVPLIYGQPREPYSTHQGTLPSPTAPLHHTIESPQATSVYVVRR